MAKKDILFEGVAYDRDNVEAMAKDGEAAFIDAMNRLGYKHHFEGDNREAKVKQLYAIVAPQANAPEITSEAPAKGAKK